jgi:N-acetylmuramoyl-L-alanine amidase
VKSSNQIPRTLRWAAALLALLSPAIAAHARVHKSKTWADTQFAAAEHLQEVLEGQPVGERTRRDYQRVIDAYRRIYLGAPSSGHADPSVVAAAQITEEMGRRFSDADISRSAIEQYEFLRREYPGSKFRFDALFRIGEIYKDDLHDKASADATFEEFLRRYPRNQFAEAARQALAEPATKQASLKSKNATTAASKVLKESKIADSTPGNDSDDDAPPDASSQADTADADTSKPSRVIGIRHWSTPDSTRVAIDLEQAVKYESQHIENPDRVFFDLLNTRLDPKLAGRTLDVSDGLLKDIRMSQFQAGRARIVLDLDALAQFDASLLSNPPRLIIDIRNTQTHNIEDGSKNSRSQPGKPPVTETTAEEKPLEKSTPESPPEVDDSPASHKPDSVTTARRKTVILNNGVKKTIVDADDDDGASSVKGAAVKDDKDTLTKLDTARLDLPAPKPAGAMSSSSTSAERTQTAVKKSKRKAATVDPEIREAQPTAAGDRSLIRALGLKIGKIVIDPGHGGHDTGTIGPSGLEEKDLVLDVSRRLGKLLQTRLGAEVIYTRKDDTFIPLETRTAIANQEAADLFVSVHANSSHDPDARGVETYYLNFTSSPEALEVAARENAVSEKSIHELQDLVKKIALKEKIEESQEFASDVQQSLHSGLSVKNPGLRDRGVKKAPFIVLIGANMPSILAEISFVSNPGDERRLGSPDYRQKIAESLYRGIAKYVSGLSGVKVASKIDKTAEQ